MTTVSGGGTPILAETHEDGRAGSGGALGYNHRTNGEEENTTSISPHISGCALSPITDPSPLLL